MIVDFLAILPMFPGLCSSGGDLRMLLLLRLLRFLKLARYSTGMRSLLDAIHAERNALAACAVILASLVLLSASFMHLAEHVEQPDKFGTIPQAMYWAVITLTTVGYGDVVPVTMLGKVIASITAVLGLGMLGAAGRHSGNGIFRGDSQARFCRHLGHGGACAAVPWSRCAETIAEIMRFLSSQIAQPGQLIVRRGEAAHSMYFIAEGRGGGRSPGRNHVSSRRWRFLWRGRPAQQREAHGQCPRALPRTSLLVLEKRDVHALMERRPDVARADHSRVARKPAAGSSAPGGG
jgi:voltage-gated potassium channel